jgi:hypothetical protein
MQYKVGQKVMVRNEDNEFGIVQLIEKVGDSGFLGERWLTNYGTRFSNDFEHTRRAAELQIAKLTEMLCKVDESK